MRVPGPRARRDACLLAASMVALAGGCVTPPPPDVRTLPAGVHVETRTTYYEVNALSAEDMKAVGERIANDVKVYNTNQFRVPGELVNVGPIEIAGVTTPHITYAYDMRRRDSVCITQNVRVLARTTVRLMHWQPPQGLSFQIVNAWSSFSAQLTAHEMQHATYAAESAQQLQKALEQIVEPTCPQVSAAVSSVGRDIFETLARNNQELDRRDHGNLIWGYARSP